MSFEVLNVRPEIIQALKEIGIVKPTKIQEQTIPLIKSGKDVVGISRTGSGKTAAFGIPLLERIHPKQGLQAIILVPTRELAVQITAELKKFAKHLHLHITSVYGGVSLGPQIKDMQTAEIVVATPGRTIDHLERRTMNLTKITCFVLDEADKMVEMGFIDHIKDILNAVPKNRQVLLFGATISDEINHLKHKYMTDPVISQAEQHVSNELLEQYYYNVNQNEKFSLLIHLLKKEPVTKGIIFCSTRDTVELIAKNLYKQGIDVEMIHGKLTQNRRQSVINKFNSGKVHILVASSVAARGLHIEEVSHVFNYDLSQDPQEYVHRVGRTARAGQSGKAITLLGHRDHDAFRVIMGKHRMQVVELPRENFERIPFVVEKRSYHDHDRNDRRGGGRSHGDKPHSIRKPYNTGQPLSWKNRVKD